MIRMKCDCGYKGKGEFGTWDREQKWLPEAHIRCPKCKSIDNSFCMTDGDCVELELKFPSQCHGSVDYGRHKSTQKAINLLLGRNGIGSYSIYCPLCQWGSCGGLENNHVKRLLKLQKQLTQSQSSQKEVRCKICNATLTENNLCSNGTCGSHIRQGR